MQSCSAVWKQRDMACRTGDLGFLSPSDGALHLCGRSDLQVKVKGECCFSGLPSLSLLCLNRHKDHSLCCVDKSSWLSNWYPGTYLALPCPALPSPASLCPVDLTYTEHSCTGYSTIILAHPVQAQLPWHGCSHIVHYI